MNQPFLSEASSTFPGPPGAPTSQIGLGNYLPRATKFRISGIRGGKSQTLEVVVKPYSYVVSGGWETGPNKMVHVETPYHTKLFSPFLEPGNVALYRR